MNHVLLVETTYIRISHYLLWNSFYSLFRPIYNVKNYIITILYTLSQN